MSLIRASVTIRSAVAVAVVVLVAGCTGSSPTRAGPSTADATATEGATATDNSVSAGNSASSGVLATEAASTPAVEGTGAESPQQPNNGGPTISVASLPVGGDTDTDGARQCAHVRLITHDQLPARVSISIDSIRLSREGIFSIGGDLCGSDRSPCAGYSWTTDTAGGECTVDVTQIKDSTETVTLVLAGTVHCPDQPACDQVQSGFDGNGSGTQIDFTASTGVISASSSEASTAGS